MADEQTTENLKPANADEIVKNIQDDIQVLKDSLLSLNESAVHFISLYDTIARNNTYDTTFLKEKMKEIVIRTVDDE